MESTSQLADLARKLTASAEETVKIAAAITALLSPTEETLPPTIAEECPETAPTTLQADDASIPDTPAPSCNNPLDADGDIVVYWAVRRITSAAARKCLDALASAQNMESIDDITVSVLVATGDVVRWNLLTARDELVQYAYTSTYAPSSRVACIVDVLSYDVPKQKCDLGLVLGLGGFDWSHVNQQCDCTDGTAAHVTLGKKAVLTLSKAPAFPPGNIPPAERAFVCSWIHKTVQLIGSECVRSDTIYDRYVRDCMVVLKRANFAECMKLMGFRAGSLYDVAIWCGPA